MKKASQITSKRRSLKQVRSRLQGCLAALFFPLGIYLSIILLGLIPVNSDFQPNPEGVEVLFLSSSVHADLILPIETETISWREQFSPEHFRGDTSSASLIAIGWGDREFFINTPTWAELRLGTALKALFWPSEACLHVYLTNKASLPENIRAVMVSVPQYKRLVDYVQQSFRHAQNGKKIPIPTVAYGSNDAFFEAHGSYNGFNTCNTWVGRAMRVTGISTGWLTPLPKTMFLYLPDG